MNRQVSLPVAAVLLAVAFLGAVLLLRSTGDSVEEEAVASAHAAVAGFEPSADNVSSDLAGRLHALTNRVESDPADTAAMLELARLLHDAHRPEEAARYYGQYLDVNPDNSEVWHDLADSHGRAGDWDTARSVMEQLLEREPEDGAVLYNLGVIEIQLGNGPAARGWLERAAGGADLETARRAREALAELDRGR